MQLKHITPLALLTAMVLTVAGCDVTAAEDAFNELGIIIELPPINTVVSGKILNANNGAPITQEMTITFAGPNGGDLIDIYSDPIASVVVKGGFFTIGLDNAVAPTFDNAAMFTASVEVPGFLAQTKQVRVFETGSGAFTIRLVSEDPRQAPKGAAGTRNTSVNSGTNGTVASAVTVTTPPTANNNVTASAAVASGTTVKDADGNALTGQITTDLTVYDNSAQSLQSLPDAAKVTDTGDPISISGGVTFKMVDTAGKVAAKFEGGSGKTASHCSAASVTIGVADADGTTVTIFAINLDTYRVVIAGTETVSGGEVHLCLGTGGFDPSSLGSAPSGIVYVAGTITELCAASATVNFNLNGWTGQLPVEATGTGVSYAGEFSHTQLSVPFTLSALIPPPFTIPAGNYTATVYSPDRSVSGSAILNPCGGGTHDITLPAPTNTISSVITVRPSCPSGQKVRVTGSLSGLSVSYVPNPNTNGADPITIPSADIVINTTSTEFTNATVTARNVENGQNVTFTVVLGGDSSDRNVTFAPTVTLTDVTDLNDLCQ